MPACMIIFKILFESKTFWKLKKAKDLEFVEDASVRFPCFRLFGGGQCLGRTANMAENRTQWELQTMI